MTQDLDERLREHNNGVSTYTRRYKPWVLVYKEYCEDMQTARIREKYFKSAAGRRYIKKLNIAH